MKILVLDTETTGLDILKHEIIQIGFIMFEIKDEKQEFLFKEQINFKPKRLEMADKIALEINGFTKSKWRGSKPFETYSEKLKDIIESSDYMLGQNLIFDLKFIKQAYENANLKVPKFPKYIDTKNMAQPLLREGKLKSASMDKMCEYYNVKFDGKAHTALTDCERTLSVWNCLKKENNIEMKYFSFKKPFEGHPKKNK
jgi:DNA polymerase-3 subunit epsilon/CBS domain-containing protein